MKNRMTWVCAVIIVLAALIASLAAAPYLPEQVATHWNAGGQADGYSSRLTGMLLMPFVMVAILFLMLAIPAIDPLKANIRLFRSEYNLLIVFLLFFFLYMHILTLLWGVGVHYDMNRAIMPGMGLLIYYMGVLVSKARRNYMIGIRTPWTLANEAVWDKTHRLGGRLFKIAGLLAFLGLIFPTQAFLFLLVPILAVTVWLLIYSYLAYRKEVPDR